MTAVTLNRMTACKRTRPRQPSLNGISKRHQVALLLLCSNLSHFLTGVADKYLQRILIRKLLFPLKHYSSAYQHFQACDILHKGNITNERFVNTKINFFSPAGKKPKLAVQVSWMNINNSGYGTTPDLALVKFLFFSLTLCNICRIQFFCKCFSRWWVLLVMCLSKCKQEKCYLGFIKLSSMLEI